MCGRFRLVPAVLAAAAWLSACAVTSADGRRMSPGSDAFGDYVEGVFRRQNELAAELALVLDSMDPNSSGYRALEDAELDLLTSCRGLNQLAVRRRDDDGSSGIGALRRARQAPDCERASDRAAELLRN